MKILQSPQILYITIIIFTLNDHIIIVTYFFKGNLMLQTKNVKLKKSKLNLNIMWYWINNTQYHELGEIGNLNIPQHLIICTLLIHSTEKYHRLNNIS